MHIDYRTLKQAGFRVETTKHGVEIYANEPYRVDWQPMATQLGEFDGQMVEQAICAFYKELELRQILAVIG